MKHLCEGYDGWFHGEGCPVPGVAQAGLFTEEQARLFIGIGFGFVVVMAVVFLAVFVITLPDRS